MIDWPPQVWAAFVAAAGAIAGWIGKRSTTKADAAAVLTDGALRVVNELQEELGELRMRMAALEGEQRREREWCDMRINQLVNTLHILGIEVPPPPDRNERR